MTSGPSRRGLVEPFHVMEVLKSVAQRQRSHGDVIMLCVGQPATSAPRAVLEAAHAALEADPLGYTEALGILPLRQRIARHYAEHYGVSVDPEEVVVTTGSSGGFVLALLAAFEAGDRVAMTRPGYPAYRNDIEALGCGVIDLECGPATRYQPTVPLLESLGELPAGLVIASPANPTGTIIEPAQLADVSRWCRERGCLLISDEIYHGISYGSECATAWQFDRENTLVVGSASKFQSMTGWRLGWLLVPTRLRRAIELLQGNLAICAPAISQWAALAAFDARARTELEGHVARYAVNRDILLRRLPEIGITSFAPPDGAFYAYCDISHLTDDSQAWCADLLQATGVALAPGIDFDPVSGNRFMRLSFCGQPEALEEALDRLVAHLR
jgi:aspartate/methionine/tyrosine aminotransferase